MVELLGLRVCRVPRAPPLPLPVVVFGADLDVDAHERQNGGKLVKTTCQ
ncbi:Uncharacterised protein [Mycobacteroides abscessus subsp. abscessus]|nr:Uncharacterised protein [Mycobacteroides abscessus subsp. abscessus]